MAEIAPGYHDYADGSRPNRDFRSQSWL